MFERSRHLAGWFGQRLSNYSRSFSATSARVPDGVRIYAVGDIHGCLQELDRLHEMILWDARISSPGHTLVVYLGDYIDRGSNSRGVLDRLCEPAPEEVSRIFLKGNHEEMLEAFFADPAAGSAWCRYGGLDTLSSYGLDVRGAFSMPGYRKLSLALKHQIPASHISFLNSLQTHVIIGDYFFCHAGVNPRYFLEEQTARDLLWIRQEFLGSRADFGKIVVHGHSPVDRPDVRANRINIDTGAYATRRLTALVLEGNTRRFIST